MQQLYIYLSLSYSAHDQTTGPPLLNLTTPPEKCRMFSTLNFFPFLDKKIPNY